MREPLRREWFVEQRDGNCRLMGSFAVRLSETARTWGRAVAPIAEWISSELWSTVNKPTRLQVPATRLTQSHKREAKGVSMRVRSVGELLRKVSKLKLAGLKRSAAMLTLSLRGENRASRRLAMKRIATRFNRVWQI
jgi:hypothetical protein